MTTPREPPPSLLRKQQQQQQRRHASSSQGHRHQVRSSSDGHQQQRRQSSSSHVRGQQRPHRPRRVSSSQGRVQQRSQIDRAPPVATQKVGYGDPAACGPVDTRYTPARVQQQWSKASAPAKSSAKQTRHTETFSSSTKSSAKRTSHKESLSSSFSSAELETSVFRSGAKCTEQTSHTGTASTCISLSSSDISASPRSKRVKWWHGIFLFSAISLLFCLLQLFLPPPFGLMQTTEEVALAKAGQQRARMLGSQLPESRHSITDKFTTDAEPNPPFSSEGCADGLKKCICPRETICADTVLYMVLLALARCSAFFDYPLYIMLFLSKAHNINNALRRTALREWIDFADMHRIHHIFGIVVGIETMSHSFFHLLRWGLRGNDIQLLWQSRTGISGLVACLATPLVVWPMALPRLKKRMSFELRKGLHYLSWAWALALVFHAPARIYWLIGIPALIYLIDLVFGFLLRTHLIETVAFERYGESCVVADIENPKGYGWDVSKTSYAYVMCPWVSKFQWHAFTIFPHPTKPDHSTLCIGVAGDWTKQLYGEIYAPTHKPVYVLGPFRSEFSDVAVSTNNAIAIASGIGITPTLSLMLSYVGKKRINVIWACRDPGLVEYFLHNVDLRAITRHSFALIFYTGNSRELVLPCRLPPNLFIFRTRPDLEKTISGIVSVIESGKGLPEEIYENQRALADIPVSQRIKIALSRVTATYSREAMFDYAVEKTEQARRRDLEAGTPFQGDDTNTNTAGRKLISREGIEETISAFLGGIGECSTNDTETLQVLFSQVDADGWGYIDREEFDSFLDLATAGPRGPKPGGKDGAVTRAKIAEGKARAESVSSMHIPRHISLGSGISRISNRHRRRGSVRVGGDDSIEHLRKLSLEKDGPLKNWSVFYCGASAPIENNLKEIKKKYGIRVAVEKFDW